MGQLKFFNGQKCRHIVWVFPQLFHPPLSLEIVFKKMHLIYCSNMTPYTEQHLKLFQATAWHQNFQDSRVLIPPIPKTSCFLVTKILQFLVLQFSCILQLFCFVFNNLPSLHNTQQWIWKYELDLPLLQTVRKSYFLSEVISTNSPACSVHILRCPQKLYSFYAIELLLILTLQSLSSSSSRAAQQEG